jgi:hypothetical protein
MALVGREDSSEAQRSSVQIFEKSSDQARRVSASRGTHRESRLNRSSAAGLRAIRTHSDAEYPSFMSTKESICASAVSPRSRASLATTGRRRICRFEIWNARIPSDARRDS